MATVQITTDAREGDAFGDQHEAFARELRSNGLVVSKATERDRMRSRHDRTEITVYLLEGGASLQDIVAEIRRAAGKCLHGTLPDLARQLVVYGPQGQHLLELVITPR